MTKKEKAFVESMERNRGISFARIGMMVQVDGDIGTIAGCNSAANLDVRFANQLKHGKGLRGCHPFWRIKYFDESGSLIEEYGD